MALLVGDKTPFDFEYRNPYDQLKTSDTGRGVAIKKIPCWCTPLFRKDMGRTYRPLAELVQPFSYHFLFFFVSYWN
jgi:hypothetical protein